jgi:alpha 1,2-mannosyltransferase
VRRRVTELTDADVQFGLIPPEHWHQPPEIDERKASEAREQMVRNRVIYGGSVPCVPPEFRRSASLLPDGPLCSYRNMCRYNSGVRLIPP